MSAAATANGHHAATAAGKAGSSSKQQTVVDLSDSAALERFQAFLRIPTITVEGPTGCAHRQAISWLQAMADALGAESRVYEYTAGYPVFVLSVAGSEPQLPSILLNSHYDVVPVMRDHWHHDPFAATVQDGKVIARGAQDMKCVCTAYLESLLRLRQRGHCARRSIHVAFQPDEETGGLQGMAQWIQTDDFRSLNVGFALDEGLANPADCYTVFYGERAVWWTRITATGPTGHGSRLILDTATEKLMTVVNRLLAFRRTQVDLLHDSSCRKHELGDVVTVNLTMLRAGVTADNGRSFSVNVIPMTAEAAFDIRIPPTFPLDEFEQRLRDWTADLSGVSYDFYQKVKVHSKTSIDPQANPYWRRFTETMQRLGRSIDPQIFPAGTDGRYLRELGIPVLGFSPIRLQPVLLHDHNESLSVHTYLEAVAVYDELIPALADMQ